MKKANRRFFYILMRSAGMDFGRVHLFEYLKNAAVILFAFALRNKRIHHVFHKGGHRKGEPERFGCFERVFQVLPVQADFKAGLKFR